MPQDTDNHSLTDLPITRVVLFSSGVGYFEHSGTVTSDARMRLQFTPAQIRDVLKSMVLTDTDGGRITGVSYPAQEPIDRALESFDIDLSDSPSLADLLGDLRGSVLTLHGSEAIHGQLLSIERAERYYVEGRVKQSDHTLSIVTDGGIRTVWLSSVDRVELEDAALQKELNKALTLIAESRNKQRRPIEVRFTGEGERRVRVGYLVDTAIWKTSYRLDVTETKPAMQGWAIVDNTSDHDWHDVELVLISGQPISFVQDLYTPLRVARPEVKPKLAPGVMPQLYGEGMVALAAGGGVSAAAEDMSMDQIGLVERAPAIKARRMMSKSVGAARGGSYAEEPLAMLDSGVASIAEGATIGELFSYTIDTPVSLDRRSSAMLPIYTGPIEGEKLSIYNQRTEPTRPLNGAVLVNDTGLKLLGGPITVFDAGVYAGDAQIEHLPPDDKRLLSYAVDLEMTVDPSDKTRRNAMAVKIAKGSVTVSTEHLEMHTYVIKNKSKTDRTLMVEHPYHAEAELLEPATYHEKTPDAYRFKLDLSPGEQKDLEVKTSWHKQHRVNLIKAPVTDLLYYTEAGRSDPKIAEVIGKAVALRGELADIEKQIQKNNQSREGITKDQERINKNLKGVGSDSTMGKRYLAKLGSQEDKLDELQAELDKLRSQQRETEQALADYLDGLVVTG
ncbi:MAG: DUF4139 domain-containing protein [Planctomycetota bacterium]